MSSPESTHFESEPVSEQERQQMLAELAEIRERTTLEASAANPELLAILTKLDRDAARLAPAMATHLRRMGTYSFLSTLLDKFFDKANYKPLDEEVYEPLLDHLKPENKALANEIFRDMPVADQAGWDAAKQDLRQFEGKAT